MKLTNNTYTKQITLILAVFTIFIVSAQDIHFTFDNAQNTIDNGEYYYEADIMIESSEAFKLGSGQIYLTYNPKAFGTSIFKNNRIVYTYEPGYILGENYVLPAYRSFIQNDNTDNRISFTFQQGVSTESITKENVTTTAKPLLHVKLKYIDVTKDPMVAYESGSVYQDQFFTACGSMLKTGDKAGFPDCANLPGVQLVNDTYDSSGASLQTLSVEEQDIAVVSMYPNPAQQYFLIQGLGNIETDIHITDINGKLVQILPSHSLENTINISQLQTGVYFVKIDTQNSRKSYKLIKE
ncbi:T9SS type A sorting domain-containing protein [Aquimarina rhabdastrellae]